MKKNINPRNFKWGSLFITLLILALGSTISFLLWFSDSKPKNHQEQQSENLAPQTVGYSPALFADLIETELAKMGFAEQVTFATQDDGQFTVVGTLTSTEKLLKTFEQLVPYEALLHTLDGEPFSVKGHLGVDEFGRGRFVPDQITIASASFPAGNVTEYLDQYTNLNQYLAVPFEEITMNAQGVFFKKDLPNVIRIALYSRALSSESE